ncbi:hypothetical protein Gogos_018478 [Gossypium gossypioides]|uniref:Uncharacterized protein n=1 Tax=Gossypium gossypioides TaxID=34282 RepID=A0A7J9BEA2_GOSGO|nr:hypothetical protein [Gossypium gossypioides]
MVRLKARILEIEKSLHQYRNRNSVLELRTSLNEIEYLKKKIEEFKTTLQNCQVRDIDHIMGEAVAQIQEVVDHLQILAVQANVLSLKYESESDRGQELA